MVLRHVNSLLTSWSTEPEIVAQEFINGENPQEFSFFENPPMVLRYTPERFMRVSYVREGPRRPGMSEKVAVVFELQCENGEARISSTLIWDHSSHPTFGR